MDYQREITKLQHECSRGEEEVVVATLATERGRCMANTIPEEDGTVLGAAVHSGSTRIVAALVDAGVDVNLCDAFWGTALHRACFHASYVEAPGLDARARLEIAQYLLDHGARTDIRNANGETPLMVAAQCGLSEMVALLLTRGIPTDHLNEALFVCIFRANFAEMQAFLACIDALCRAGAEANGAKGSINQHPLFAACSCRTKVGVPLAMALLRAGARAADADADIREFNADRLVLEEALAQIGDTDTAHAQWLAVGAGRRIKAAK